MADQPLTGLDIASVGDIVSRLTGRGPDDPATKDLFAAQVATVQKASGMNQDKSATAVALGYVKEGQARGVSPAEIAAQIKPLQAYIITNTIPKLASLPKIVTAAELIALPLEVAAIVVGITAGAPLAIVAGLGALGWTIAQIPKMWYDNNVVAPSQAIQALKFTDEILAGKYDAKPKAIEGFSAEEIEGLYQGYVQDGALGIVDPIAKQSLTLSAKTIGTAIADAAKMLRTAGKNPTQVRLLAALRTMIVFGDYKTPRPQVSTPAPSTAGTTTKAVKVFTGIVSQGTLGAGLIFEPRPSDMIDSVAELETAAQNNLAAYLVTLPGKIKYEIKIVSSVITKDGYKQTGTSQQLVVGTNKNGTPKYKTVVNRFAVLTLYFLTDKGSRSNIGTIILGPTNAATLNPTGETLRQLEGSIQSNITSTKVSDIKAVETSTNVAVFTPTSSPAVVANQAGASAQTLYEWYTANGKPLPPIADRAAVYQQFGLGSATLYTGTAEQNSRLLAALKAPAPAITPQSVPAASQPGSTVYVPVAGATYYNNGRNGTPLAYAGSEAEKQNAKYQAIVGALLANPANRNIVGNPAGQFTNGDITLEQLTDIVNGSPKYSGPEQA